MTQETPDRTTQPSVPLARRFDVAIVGGGAAGLSAALVLARSRRSVIVIDAGSPRNVSAAGVHGFLTRDGTNPLELLALGRAEVEAYGGTIIHGEATDARRTVDAFTVALADGRQIDARRLVITTGLVDELPDIPGLRERWGDDVLHCPYCHGWELRDQPVGILSTGPMAVHQALLFRQLTSDLVLFTHTGPALTDQQAEELAALDIQVVPGHVAAIEADEHHLTGVRLEDGSVIARRALVVGPRMVARAGVLASLGITPRPNPIGGEYIAADANGLTEIPGIWVAGNVADLKAQVVVAAAGGASVGAQVNFDLVAEDTRRAVAAHRDQLTVTPRRQTAAPHHQIASAS